MTTRKHPQMDSPPDYDRDLDILLLTVKGSPDYIDADSHRVERIRKFIHTQLEQQRRIEAGELAIVPQSALDWLFGEGPDENGEYFGSMYRPDIRNKYWWRKHFKKLISEE